MQLKKNLPHCLCIVALIAGAILAVNAADKEPKIQKRIVGKWENGQPRIEESYYSKPSGETVSHGPYVYYFENGKKRIELFYVHGKRNGQLTEWNSDGTVERQGSFKDDRETGKWTWWQLTGEKHSECTYVDGRVVGKKIYWMNKKVVREDVYDKKGYYVAEVTTWFDFENGQKLMHGTFKGGQKHGAWTYWEQDGKIKVQGEWKNGKPWDGVCGVPVAGDAGSWGGLETFQLFRNGKKIEQTFCWQQGAAIYRDRDHDGKIDWEVSGETWRFDGIDTYKADTNYDGFYDLKYGKGGLTGGIYSSTNIHEIVPVAGKDFVPIKKPDYVE